MKKANLPVRAEQRENKREGRMEQKETGEREALCVRKEGKLRGPSKSGV